MNTPTPIIWRNPQTDPPTTTGHYLVELHQGEFNSFDIVRVEETFMEYLDETPADPDEWKAWAEIPASNLD